MPTVLRIGPYRFYFYAGDRLEPPHIHVGRDDSEVKFWLDPLRVARSYGFSRKEISIVQRLVEANLQRLMEAGHEFFSD